MKKCKKKKKLNGAPRGRTLCTLIWGLLLYIYILIDWFEFEWINPIPERYIFQECVSWRASLTFHSLSNLAFQTANPSSNSHHQNIYIYIYLSNMTRARSQHGLDMEEKKIEKNGKRYIQSLVGDSSFVLLIWLICTSLMLGLGLSELFYQVWHCFHLSCHSAPLSGTTLLSFLSRLVIIFDCTKWLQLTLKKNYIEPCHYK